MDKDVEKDIGINRMPGYLKFSIVGIFAVLLIAALHEAKPFFVPVVLAFLFALTLNPVIRYLNKFGMPNGVSAAAMIVFLTTLIGGAGYLLGEPLTEWNNRFPNLIDEVTARFEPLSDAEKAITEASDSMDKGFVLTNEVTSQVVNIANSDITKIAATHTLEAIATYVITLVLLFFLLASGDMFYRKMVESMPTLTDKKRALKLVRNVEEKISHYLFTVSLINCSLGFAVTIGLYFLGMPNPLLFGAMAALLNFLPYIGGLIGVVVMLLVSIVTFDSIGQTVLIVVFYYACTFIEGYFVTPAILGRRLELNAVAIFIFIAFWAWLWGLIGALIAVPILVIIKITCDNFESLQPVAVFLAGEEFDPKKEPAIS